MEKDDDAGAYDFGARLYNPQIGRWWSVDPKESKYPMFSPYHAMGNNPIITIDPNGEENVVVVGNQGGKGEAPDSDIDGYGNGARYFIESGLNEAVRMSKNAQNGEATTLIVYQGEYSQETLERLRNDVRLKDNNITLIEVSNSDQVENYINTKTKWSRSKDVGGRQNDLITDFTYIGHASPEALLLGHNYNNSDNIDHDNLKEKSFHSKANCELRGCGTSAHIQHDRKGNLTFSKVPVFDKFKQLSHKLTTYTTTIWWSMKGYSPAGTVYAHYSFRESLKKANLLKSRYDEYKKAKEKKDVYGMKRLEGKRTDTFSGTGNQSNSKVNGEDLKQ